MEKGVESFDQSQGEESAFNQVEPFVSSPYFGVDNLRNAPACLDLRLPDGNRKALPYSYIVEINYSLSDGIEIISTTKKVMITGRNLKNLYNYIIAYRVKHIQANIGNDLTEENVLFVKDITIEEV
ncbi:MAG: hypothetical protein EOP48_15975 [Sphingobacteriales bacterium]|nr:MAG: hypothetical protein EOP48_15975 [Sphingobacteriales bacterium]